jgi:hypothetical protein
MVSRSGSRPPCVSVQRVIGRRSASARVAAFRSRSRSRRGVVRYWSRKRPPKPRGLARRPRDRCWKLAVLAEGRAHPLDLVRPNPITPRPCSVIPCCAASDLHGSPGRGRTPGGPPHRQFASSTWNPLVKPSGAAGLQARGASAPAPMDVLTLWCSPGPPAARGGGHVDGELPPPVGQALNP